MLLSDKIKYYIYTVYLSLCVFISCALMLICISILEVASGGLLGIGTWDYLGPNSKHAYYTMPT